MICVHLLKTDKLYSALWWWIRKKSECVKCDWNLQNTLSRADYLITYRRAGIYEIWNGYVFLQNSSFQCKVSEGLSTCYSDLMSGKPRQPALPLSQPQSHDGVVVFSMVEGETVCGGGRCTATQPDGYPEPHCRLPFSFPLDHRIWEEMEEHFFT